MSMSLTYSTEEREAVIKTTRAAGAVGRFPLVYRMFRERFKRTDIKVLDYGSGVDVPHARELEREGWTVEAMDLGLPEWINDVARERGPFDVVLCSNVLNVQPNLALVISVLYDLRSLIAEGGTLIINYPASPRKADLLIADIRTALLEVFGGGEGSDYDGFEDRFADYVGVFVVTRR